MIMIVELSSLLSASWLTSDLVGNTVGPLVEVIVVNVGDCVGFKVGLTVGLKVGFLVGVLGIDVGDFVGVSVDMQENSQIKGIRTTSLVQTVENHRPANPLPPSLLQPMPLAAKDSYFLLNRNRFEV